MSDVQAEMMWAFMAGQMADQNGEFTNAVSFYRRALQYDPHSNTLRRYLVSDLIRLERFQEARQEYRVMIEDSPEDRQTRFILAQLYEASGDTKTAEALYRDAIALGAETSGPFTKLGLLLMRQEKTRESTAFLRQALAIDPFDREARHILVNYHQLKGKNQESIRLLQEALANTPDDIEWLSALAKIYDALDMKEKAAETYTQLQQANPNAREAYRFLSIYYLHRNDWEGAVRQLEKLLRLNGNDLLARRNMGLALYKMGAYDEARHHLTILVDQKAADALTHYLLGSIFQQRDFHHLAADEFRQAVQMDQNLVEAHLGLASALMAIQEVDQAVEVLENASRQFGTISQVLINYGLILLRMEKPAAALQIFKRAQELMPRNAMLYFHIGRAYYELNQFQQAVDSWKRSIRLDRTLADAYNHLGYTHAERGENLGQAVSWLKTAMALDPKNGYYLDSLGWAYYKQGKYQQALEMLQAACGLLQKARLPIETVIYDHLGDIYFQLRRYQEAGKAWRQALKEDPENKQIQDKMNKLPPQGKQADHDLVAS